MQILCYHGHFLPCIPNLFVTLPSLLHMKTLRQTSKRRQRRLAKSTTLWQTQRIARRVALHSDPSERRERLHIGDRKVRRGDFARLEARSRRLHRPIGCVQRALHRVLRRRLQTAQQNASMACMAHWTVREGGADR